MRGRLVIGFILLALGVGFLFDAVDFPSESFRFGSVIGQYWPVVLIVVGLAQVRHSPIGAGILMLVGAALLGHYVWNLDVWAMLWPAILIIIGLALLFSRGPRHRGGGRRNVRVTGRLDRTAIMGGFKDRVEGEFREGSVTAMMGGGDLDLRWAKLSPDGATVEATAIMGAVKLIVPDSWRIDITGPGIFGAVENKARSPTAGPLLTVKATAVFGAVEVTN